MRHFPRTPRGPVCVFGVLAATLLVACGGSPAAPSSITVLPALSEMIADKTMGPASATNTIIDYSSFTCPHCADFHLQTFPQLKSKWIDTGKAKYIFRDWKRNDLDLHAGMLARCAGDSRYFDAVDTLFRNQASWTGSDAALANVMRQFGMSQQVIDTCLASTALSDAITREHDEAVQRFGVYGTPTFVVNDHIVVGEVPLSTIEGYLR